jgi:hypothetical protein
MGHQKKPTRLKGGRYKFVISLHGDQHCVLCDTNIRTCFRSLPTEVSVRCGLVSLPTVADSRCESEARQRRKSRAKGLSIESAKPHVRNGRPSVLAKRHFALAFLSLPHHHHLFITSPAFPRQRATLKSDSHLTDSIRDCGKEPERPIVSG